MKKETIHLDWVLNSFYDFIYLLIHTGEGGRRSQRHTSLYKKTRVGCLLYVPTWLSTQAWALTLNHTGHPSVGRKALKPLSHTSKS